MWNYFAKNIVLKIDKEYYFSELYKTHKYFYVCKIYFLQKILIKTFEKNFIQCPNQ